MFFINNIWIFDVHFVEILSNSPSIALIPAPPPTMLLSPTLPAAPRGMMRTLRSRYLEFWPLIMSGTRQLTCAATTPGTTSTSTWGPWALTPPPRWVSPDEALMSSCFLKWYYLGWNHDQAGHDELELLQEEVEHTRIADRVRQKLPRSSGLTNFVDKIASFTIFSWPVQGCLQYYFGNGGSGTVEAFNYNQPTSGYEGHLQGKASHEAHGDTDHWHQVTTQSVSGGREVTAPSDGRRLNTPRINMGSDYSLDTNTL